MILLKEVSVILATNIKLKSLSMCVFDLIFIYHLGRWSYIQAYMSSGFSAAIDISTEELPTNSRSNYDYRFGWSVPRYFSILGSQDAISTDQILPHEVL